MIKKVDCQIEGVNEIDGFEKISIPVSSFCSLGRHLIGTESQILEVLRSIDIFKKVGKFNTNQCNKKIYSCNCLDMRSRQTEKEINANLKSYVDYQTNKQKVAQENVSKNNKTLEIQLAQITTIQQ